MKEVKIILKISLIILVLVSSGVWDTACQKREVKKLDIKIFGMLRHSPVQPIIKELKTLFEKHGKKLEVSWYDLQTAEGRQAFRTQGFKGHTPVMVFINGRHRFELDGKEIICQGFPEGVEGCHMMAGMKRTWSIKDLDRIITSELKK